MLKQKQTALDSFSSVLIRLSTNGMSSTPALHFSTLSALLTHGSSRLRTMELAGKVWGRV